MFLERFLFLGDFLGEFGYRILRYHTQCVTLNIVSVIVPDIVHDIIPDIIPDIADHVLHAGLRVSGSPVPFLKRTIGGI